MPVNYHIASSYPTHCGGHNNRMASRIGISVSYISGASTETHFLSLPQRIVKLQLIACQHMLLLQHLKNTVISQEIQFRIACRSFKQQLAQIANDIIFNTADFNPMMEIMRKRLDHLQNICRNIYMSRVPCQNC